MEAMKRRHAVVLGGSIAGMAAARALESHFERVTLIERDDVSTDGAARKGVPQADHAHGLLTAGYRVLDSWFPGLMADLDAAGGWPGDVVGDFLWFQYGAFKLRADLGLVGIVNSRDVLETKIREHLRRSPKLTILDRHDCEEPIFDSASSRVTGVRIRDRVTGATTTLDADFVVDALGRGSPTPKWLAAWGFGEVAASVVEVDVRYATTFVEHRDGDLYGANGGIIAGTPPESKRYAAILKTEDKRWRVTLVGMLGDHPPTDVAGWREFARGLPTDHVFNLVNEREPTDPIATYRFDSYRWRHYERMARFPLGYVPLGDAVCCLNPIYGQGISSVVCQAKALEECLAEGDVKLASRYFRRVVKVIEMPWTIATGEDFRYPGVVGKRPPAFGLISKYLAKVHHVATRDPVVLRAIMNVANLLAPPTSIMAPNVAWRVLFGRADAPASSPERKEDLRT